MRRTAGGQWLGFECRRCWRIDAVGSTFRVDRSRLRPPAHRKRRWISRPSESEGHSQFGTEARHVVSGVSREPEAVVVTAAGYRLMSAWRMIALEFGLVKLVEDGRSIVGIPDGDVLLRGRVESAVREGSCGRLRNCSAEALELRGGEDRAVRHIGHMLGRARDAAVSGALEADGGATR